MKVSLIDYTGNHHKEPDLFAAAILAFTKNTRLNMTANSFEHFTEMPRDMLYQELAYMARTIPSSWEFVDYTFMIEGVSRAFTHQLVRKRTASFAQQSMRVTHINALDVHVGPTIRGDARDMYQRAVDLCNNVYNHLIGHEGVAIEDARGILPTNIHTNIAMKLDMRALVTMVRERSSPRVQGEYREVLDDMKGLVVNVHPFIEMFIDRGADRAARDLDVEIEGIEDKEKKMRMLKLVDEMRRGE